MSVEELVDLHARLLDAQMKGDESLALEINKKLRASASHSKAARMKRRQAQTETNACSSSIHASTSKPRKLLIDLKDVEFFFEYKFSAEEIEDPVIILSYSYFNAVFQSKISDGRPPAFVLSNGIKEKLQNKYEDGLLFWVGKEEGKTFEKLSNWFKGLGDYNFLILDQRWWRTTFGKGLKPQYTQSARKVSWFCFKSTGSITIF